MTFALRFTAFTTYLKLTLLTLLGAQPARLEFPNTEKFLVNGRPAFLYLPAAEKRSSPQPWILYAPTLPPYPDAAERWMHEQFLAAGIAVAGIDVGESYGSPTAHPHFDALYRELTEKRGFTRQAGLLARSRGGLQLSAWAIANPTKVAAFAGIYPVFDLTTYPGLTNAAPAYELAPAELQSRLAEFNPISRIDVLAREKIPILLIHGDNDKVVPLPQNSAEFERRYKAAQADTNLIQLIVLPGQGHNMFPGFFHSQELVNFLIKHAISARARTQSP